MTPTARQYPPVFDAAPKPRGDEFGRAAELVPKPKSPVPVVPVWVAQAAADVRAVDLPPAP